MKKAFLYLIYVAIVVGISVAIGLTFHSDTNKKPQVAQKPAGQAISKSQPEMPKTSTKTPTPAAPKKTTPAPAPKVTTPSAPVAASPAADNAILVNTGPGNIISIFAVTAVIGSIGFSRYQRKTL